MRLSLNKQILIIIFVSVMITFVSVLFVNNKLFLEVFKEKFHEKIKIIGTEFSKVASLSLLLHRKEILDKRAESIINDEDITGIEIINNKGEIIFRKGFTEGYKVVFPMLIKRFSNENFFEGEEKDEPIGNVTIYYTRENIKRLMLKIFLLSVIISFFIAIIVFLFAYRVLSKNFIMPLKFLTDHIEEEDKLIEVYNSKYLNVSYEIKTLYESYLKMLKELKDNYKKLIQQKTLAEIGNFSLTIAHEIKNPLGIIKGAFDIIKKKEIDEKTKLEMISYVEEEIVRIDKLIKDFLLMAKNVNINLEDININMLIENILEKLKINYQNVVFKFNSKNQLIKKSDKDLLTQVLINLIKNSIEAESDVINILTLENEDKWIIKVIDNGKGIDDKIKSKIFDPFYTTKKEGSGIGLTYVAKAVYQLGGAINVSSKKGEGAVFTIEFKNK